MGDYLDLEGALDEAERLARHPWEDGSVSSAYEALEGAARAFGHRRRDARAIATEYVIGAFAMTNPSGLARPDHEARLLARLRAWQRIAGTRAARDRSRPQLGPARARTARTGPRRELLILSPGAGLTHANRTVCGHMPMP